MCKYPLTIAALALITLIAQPSVTLQAQAAPPKLQQDNSIQFDLKAAVLRAIGAPEGNVQITKKGSILKIARINRKMSESTAVGRENEASAIVTAISQSIPGNEKSAGIVTVRIEYVLRPMAGSDKVFDVIVYREDASGAFQHHQT